MRWITVDVPESAVIDAFDYAQRSCFIRGKPPQQNR